jgi:hypothetical protein
MLLALWELGIHSNLHGVVTFELPATDLRQGVQNSVESGHKAGTGWLSKAGGYEHSFPKARLSPVIFAIPSQPSSAR